MDVGAIHAAGHKCQEYQREGQNAREADIHRVAGRERGETEHAKDREEGVIQGVAQQESAHGGDREGNEEDCSFEKTGSDLAAGRAVREREDRPTEARQHLAGEETAAPDGDFFCDHILALGLARKEDGDGVRRKRHQRPDENVRFSGEVHAAGGDHDHEEGQGHRAVEYGLDVEQEHFAFEAGWCRGAGLQPLTRRANGLRNSFVSMVPRSVDYDLVGRCAGGDAHTSDQDWVQLAL
ncbi:hypothetical protein ACVI3U_000421 [Sinorhizobium medicae]